MIVNHFAKGFECCQSAKRTVSYCAREFAKKIVQRKSPECPECADNFSAGRMQDISREAELEEVKLRWSALQDKLRDEVIDKDVEKWEKNLENVKLVCGMDISTPKEDNSVGVACVVICSFPDLELVHQVTEEVEVKEPYIPGFLAFREALPLLKILNGILNEREDLKPDVILVDGNGILHPRKYGCACHIGVSTGIPTIGVAKNIYKMDDIDYDKLQHENLVSPGDYVLIKQNGSILGMALKTAKDAKNPIYVSVGHKISLEAAKNVVLKCSKFRVPEPIRFADFNSREVIRKGGSIKSRTE